MFSFQVKIKGHERVGSIVSTPFVKGDSSYVIVMWDDDFSFEELRVQNLQATPVMAAGREGDAIVQFPVRGEDETAH